MFMARLGTCLVKVTLAFTAGAIAEYVESAPTEVEVRGQGWWSMNEEQLALDRIRHEQVMQRSFGLTNVAPHFDAIDQSYLRSGFLKAHPEIKYAYGSVIALGYKFHEEPRRERQTRISGVAFGSEMLMPDTNGFIIEVEFAKPIKPGILTQGRVPERTGLSLNRLEARYREFFELDPNLRTPPRFFECGTVLLDRGVAIRVYIRYNDYTDLILLQQAFAPIAAAFANEKQTPPPEGPLGRAQSP
jgi:hypothetical protein